MTQARYGTARRRAVSLVALVALALALALAGCGGRGAHGQNNGGVSASTSQSGAGSNAAQVQSADQQVQSALSGLDSTENSATSADGMSQEGTVLP